MAKIFEEVDLRENHVFISGNGAAIKWTGTGVGRNGREVKFEGIDVIEMNEKGRIQKLWAYWQPEALMIQLQQ
jgi:steroid delta-isomerase